jgi:uncharacterized protein YjbI with pentapeptide repeats
MLLLGKPIGQQALAAFRLRVGGNFARFWPARGQRLPAADETRWALPERRLGVTALIEIKDKTTGEVLYQVDATKLVGVDLSHALLRNARLSRTVLTKADLQGADLSDADLSFSTLAQANLREALLSRAQLMGASLIGATLAGAMLDQANLHNACLFQANLQGASLRGARLTGADLAGSQLQSCDLSETTFDKFTRWPDGFKPQSHGAIEVSR